MASKKSKEKLKLFLKTIRQEEIHLTDDKPSVPKSNDNINTKPKTK